MGRTQATRPTGTTSQDLGSLGGKVLRVVRATGAPAPGNPFPGSRVFTLGHRNVQGLAVRTGGKVFAVEHGPDRDDEVNLLRPGGKARSGATSSPGPSGATSTAPSSWPASEEHSCAARFL